MKADSFSVGPEFADVLGECEPGDTKRVMVTMTVGTHDEKGITGTITAVEPYEEEVEEEPAPSPKASAIEAAAKY
jgi:hypothetical protein